MKTKKPIAVTVAFRFNKLDKAALVELARRLQMNHTDTVRILVRESLAVLKERSIKVPTRQGNHDASRANP